MPSALSILRLESMTSKEHVTICCAELLKELRLKAKLSQGKLGERMQSDQSYVSLIEQGERRMTLASLERYAIGLGVPLRTLISSLSKKLLQTD